MPRTVEDVETYLSELDRHFEKTGDGTYIVSMAGTRVAVHVAPPIVAVRVAIGPVPADAKHQVKLFRRLLELNGTDLMHSSYAIEDDTVVLSAALALENLDKNELELTLSDIDLALTRHVAGLHEAAQE